MDALIDRLFSVSKTNEPSFVKKYLNSHNFLMNNNFQTIPIEYHQHLFENSLFTSDFSATSPPKASKWNWHSFLSTLNNNLFFSAAKLSPLIMQEYLRQTPSHLNVGRIVKPNLGNLWESAPLQRTYESNKESLVDHLVVSLSNAILPAIKNNINSIIIKNDQNSKMISKKMDCNLDQQMANRKAKELQKRSKKRRRRQKKNNATPSSSNNDCKVKKHNITNTTVNSFTDKKSNCDILCDVTINPCSKTVEIMLPNASAFLVTVETSEDDDSDWDTCDKNDFVADDSEFQVCGLFVTSFTATNSSNLPFTDDDNDLDHIYAKLKEVNKQWENATKDIKTRKKSVTLVSFAPDEELVEIYPVEMYERKGEWEIYARERHRFKKRIHEIEEILSPILTDDHREKIYKSRQNIL